MQFAHAIWLVAGLVACTFLGFAFVHFHKKGQVALKKFASGRLLDQLTKNVSQGRRQIKRIFILTAVAALFAALARPQAGFEWKEVKRKGIDILMAVDTSKSMLAADVKPNRLKRSKLGIMDFVSRLEGDRVGLIPFAGTAFLMCPLTLDYDAFRQSLEALDTQIIPQGGTDLASAIREAEFAFSNDANHRILVLVTDGEDLEGEALSAAKEAAEKGLTIYTVGVGTPAGELIPLQKAGKGVAFAKDEKGQVVKSRLDEEILREIAHVTGGQYEPLGQQAEGLEAIYQGKLSLVPKQELAERKQKVPVDRFEWPLLAAFILLVLEFGLSDRKTSGKGIPVIKTARRRVFKGEKGARAAASIAVVLALMMGVKVAGASPGSAEKAYLEGDYSRAETEYRAEAEKLPENSQLKFNLGTAAYKSGKFDEALSAFQAALNAREIVLQNQGYYNMGNTLYRQGQGTEKSSPKDTIKKWESSIQAYEGALQLDPKDQDAVFNRDFVKKRLKELKKQQEKDQKQNKKEPDKCDNKKKDQDKNQAGKQDKEKKGKDGNGGNQQAKKQDQKKENKGKEQNSKKSGSDNNQKGKEDQKQARANGGDKPEPEKDSPQNGPNGEASAKKDEIKPRDPNGKPPAPVRTERRRRPGEMTEEQAQNLLDSLKGEDQDMPVMADGKGTGKAVREKKRRDW